jgi:amino acid adenylation domain-containing protein
VENTSLYIVLLSLYTIFLSRITGQEDIVVGTPVAGRRHADVQPIIGMFVNTLGIRNYLEGRDTVGGFLQEVKERALESFENQDYPFEDLVENLEIKRDTGRNPLFDVMFTLQNMERTDIEIPALKLIPYNYEKKTSKFDLTLHAVESENGLQFTFEYCTRLFREETVERFTRYFRRTVASVLTGTGQKIWEIEILAEAEKRLLLDGLNNTGAEYPGDKTLHELFAEQAAGNPDRTAVRLGTHHLTYSELDAGADGLSRVLRAGGAGPDTIVGILAKRSIRMLVGIFGILKAGGAYLPIEPDTPETRVSYMLADSNAGILVSESGVKSKGNEGIEVVNPAEAGAEFPTPLTPLNHFTHPAQLCYVIYTSGTTGKPKGVLINHQSAVNYVWWAIKQYVRDQEVNFPLYTSLSFDLTVTSIFTPLLSGNTVVIYEGERKESLIGDIIEENRVEVVKLTPSHLKLILEQPAGGILSPGGKIKSAVRRFIVGGESLETKLAGEIAGRFKDGPVIYNEYGPTEAAVGCMIHAFSPGEDIRQSVSIGVAADNVQIYLLGRNTNPVPPGVPGEIYISGAGVARGYLNRPGLTAERFVKNPFIPGKRMYRTGDLARYLAGWNIEFLGRIDHQVKIRGYRIEPGEIENHLLAHERIKDALVVVKEVKGDRYLCAYIVPDSTYSPQPLNPEDFVPEVQLRDYLSGALPDYMIPSFFIPLEKIPLTSHGKVDRGALPDPVFRGSETYVPPRNKVEEKLAEIWAEVLGIEKETVGINANFFQLGGHSLKATVLAARIHKEFNTRISLTEIFNKPTIRELAGALTTAEKADFIDLHKVEAREYYELSFNQRRLWIVNRFNPDSAAYNMPGRVVFQHKIEEDVLKRVLLKIVKRHEAFRTGFKTVRNEPVQFLVEEAEITVPLKKVDLSLLGDKEKQEKREETFNEEALVPFDLTRAPLLRTVLVKLDEERYEFIFNMHHIISDGWSLEIIKREFPLLYEAERFGKGIELEPLKFQYKDFAAWQNKKLKDPVLKEKSHRYWLAKLTGRLSPAGLPAEYGETAGAEDTGIYRCVMAGALKDRLNQLVRDNNTSLFVLMFTVFNILLARFRGQKDILCGIPAAGRDHYSLNNLVGFFVNTLILHNRVDYEISFTDFLRNVGEDTLAALQHQGYPLELVLEDLNMNFPRIDVFFNMLNLGPDLEKEKYTPAVPANETIVPEAKFDMVLYISEYQDGTSSWKRNSFPSSAPCWLHDARGRRTNPASGRPICSLSMGRRTTPCNTRATAHASWAAAAGFGRRCPWSTGSPFRTRQGLSWIPS